MRARVAAGPMSDRPGTPSRNIRKNWKSKLPEKRVLLEEGSKLPSRIWCEAGPNLTSQRDRERKDLPSLALAGTLPPLKPRRACVPSTPTTTNHPPDEEKQNPRNPLFRPMKLYKRSEIRYRAHKRFGGLEGLVEERNKRRKRKLERDMEEARNIFE